MIGLLTMAAFVPAAPAPNLTPGAAMMVCLGQGLRGGPRAALAADAGIALGCMVHVTIAGLALAARLALGQKGRTRQARTRQGRTRQG